MPPLSIPILTLRLLDVELPVKPYAQVNFMGAAKDLLRDNQQRADAAQVSLQLFHNKAIAYSAIQLDRHQGAAEWTAYGEEAVEALWFWLELYREENPQLLQNSVAIQEHYSPGFLPNQKDYQIGPMLLNDELAKSLNRIHHKNARYGRLEKYLYGNLQTFLKFIGYTYDKEAHFLKVEVLEAHPYDRALTVYHNQKKTAFNIKFKCNFKLPQTLRLGQSTALGYGKISHL
jgi:hypothetical protein